MRLDKGLLTSSRLQDAFKGDIHTIIQLQVQNDPSVPKDWPPSKVAI